MVARLTGLGALALAALALALPPAAPAAAVPPPIHHVFVIVLENRSYNETFAPNSPAPYLSQTLTAQGQLLQQYYGIGHESNDNYAALISGQAPNVATQGDCLETYSDFVGAPTLGPDGQAVGQGCIYPTIVPSLPDQLEAKGLTWKGYMEDMKTPCNHPAVNSIDQTQTAHVGNQYATRHDPFMYFHRIIDDPARCAAHVVDLSQLGPDLTSAATTPNFSFIVPNLCDDGHDSPCVDGRPGGLVSADIWLRTYVPAILASPAMRDGMLIVLFDEADTSQPNASAACCNEQPGPNSPDPGGPTPGPGGGQTGAVVISPFVQPGSVNTTPYNHYSLLRSIEDLFGLDHLGYAAAAGLQPFGADVYDRAAAPGPIPGVGASGGGPVCPAPPLAAAHRGVLARGSLIASARVLGAPRVAQPRRRTAAAFAGRVTTARLRLRMRRAAGLSVRVGRRRVGPRQVAGCRTYVIGLGARHGRVVVVASTSSGHERRVLRF